MLFNAPGFIFGFLPLTLLLFYGLARYRPSLVLPWLVLASLIFYGWWDWRYLAVLLPSIAFNFWMGEKIKQTLSARRKHLLWLGLGGNLLALAAFKYTAFFVATLNDGVGHVVLNVPNIGLPLGISFFTFTQIAYLVDVHDRKVTDSDPLAYGLFVTFFPHLIAGPILHHGEMMPQFRSPTLGQVDWTKIKAGSVLFLIGLFKKVVLADTFAQWVGPAFDVAPALSFVEAWAASLSYTFELYFDFSGYCDMAVGLGLMINITLPFNFNSPYKALTIQDFWQRWHMTLSRFLRDYLYIPLGGNRHGLTHTLLALMVVFLLGGLWHGAGWTFVAWGAVHGSAAIIHRLWHCQPWRMPRWLAWLITFMFVNAAWVLFRAQHWGDAIKVYKGMLGQSGFTLPSQIIALSPSVLGVFKGVGSLAWAGGGSVMGLVDMTLLTLTAFALIAWPLNSNQVMDRPSLYTKCLIAFPFVVQALVFSQSASPFLYFRF